MMSLSDAILEKILAEENVNIRLKILIDEFFHFCRVEKISRNTPRGKLSNYFEGFADYYAAAKALISAAENIEISFPEEVSGDGAYCINILNFFVDLRELNSKHVQSAVTETSEKKYAALFNDGFVITIEDADQKRIQKLINGMRDFISNSNSFDDKHKARLLSRLEKLQSELHKRVSDVDRFWGLIGDAGVAAGKLGKDAKPFVDRIKEISEIIWRSQARAEGLPSSIEFPQLGHDGPAEEDSE